MYMEAEMSMLLFTLHNCTIACRSVKYHMFIYVSHNCTKMLMSSTIKNIQIKKPISVDKI